MEILRRERETGRVRREREEKEGESAKREGRNFPPASPRDGISVAREKWRGRERERKREKERETRERKRERERERERLREIKRERISKCS